MKRALVIVSVGFWAAHCGAPKATPLTREQLLDSQTCAGCHPDQYQEWSGSMHAYASDDPVFLAFQRRGQRETNGTLGGFCLPCHAPMAVREGVATDGTHLDDVPAKLKGVTCIACHAVDRVEGLHNNGLVMSPDLGVLRGPLSDAMTTTAHRSSYSSLVDRDRSDSSTLCGSCHDLQLGSGALLERLYSEWASSVFSHANGASCGQCHMDQSADLRPITTVRGAPLRRTHSHTMPALDVAITPGFPDKDRQRKAIGDLLRSTLQTGLCVVDYGNGTGAVRVIVDNVAAGHGFPSGAAFVRRLWVEVVASQGATTVYQSGVVPDGGDPTASPDPDRWLIRDCALDATGNAVTMPWKISDFEGNVLPALATFDVTDPRYYQTHVLQPFPRASGGRFPLPDKVTLRVHLQPMGFDILNELAASGDLSAADRLAMPTFDIDLGKGPELEWTQAKSQVSWTEENRYLVRCVTDSNLNTSATTVPAVKTRCSP